MNKAASVGSQTPIKLATGKTGYVRLIENGPAEAIEIVINISIRNTRNLDAEIKAAKEWANEALKTCPSLKDLPPTTVSVRPTPRA
jgi:hypothetical protein